MGRSPEELTQQLDALEATLPDLLRDHPDEDDFWCAFAGETDHIEDHAGDHCGFVRGRIDAMLARHGLIPSEIDETP